MELKCAVSCIGPRSSELKRVFAYIARGAPVASVSAAIAAARGQTWGSTLAALIVAMQSGGDYPKPHARERSLHLQRLSGTPCATWMSHGPNSRPGGHDIPGSSGAEFNCV